VLVHDNENLGNRDLPDLADGVDTSGRRDTLDLGAVDTALTAAATAHLQ